MKSYLTYILRDYNTQEMESRETILQVDIEISLLLPRNMLPDRK